METQGDGGKLIYMQLKHNRGAAAKPYRCGGNTNRDTQNSLCKYKHCHTWWGFTKFMQTPGKEKKKET